MKEVAVYQIPVLSPSGRRELAADLPDECGGLHKKKQYRYGKVLVTRYEKERAE